MDRLAKFPLNEPRKIRQLRSRYEAAPDSAEAQSELGIALADGGCSYEAAVLLRPTRSIWKSSPQEAVAQSALAAQTWWNKNWSDFARRKHANDRAGALALLGDRAVEYWDLPALLVHLGDFACADGKLDLAEHLFRRVQGLANRGLPRMNMQAFEYTSQASLIDVLLLRGKAKAAMTAHAALTPNPGNAMAHDVQKARVLVANKRDDDAMRCLAGMLVTAENKRSGYSKVMRVDFVERSPELDRLRRRSDWKALIDNPSRYGKSK